MTSCCGGIASDGILEKSPENKDLLSKYIESLPLNEDRDYNRGFLIQTLHKAQELYGFLPESVQVFVAKKLGLHLSEIYGVISFYSFFTDKPQGKNRIHVCTGTACFVKGAGKILEEFSRKLSIKEGETSSDGKFSLGGLRCVGACSLAPVVMVNDKVYGNVVPSQVDSIIKDCDK